MDVQMKEHVGNLYQKSYIILLGTTTVENNFFLHDVYLYEQKTPLWVENNYCNPWN